MARVRQHPTYPRFRMKLGSMPDFSGSKYVKQEEPMGVKNGVNRVFTLLNQPLPDSEEVYKDGMLMAVNLDYTIDFLNKKITFSADQIPQENSVIRVNYKYV